MPSSATRACSSARYFSSRPAPDDRELPAGELVAGQRPRPEQPVAVLVRPQGRDEQHERLRDAVGRDLAAGQVGVARREQVVIDGLVDQPELGRVDVQVRSTSDRRLSELMMIASATFTERG